MRELKAEEKVSSDLSIIALPTWLEEATARWICQIDMEESWLQSRTAIDVNEPLLYLFLFSTLFII